MVDLYRAELVYFGNYIGNHAFSGKHPCDAILPFLEYLAEQTNFSNFCQYNWTIVLN